MQQKYLQSYGRTKSRKLRDSGVRLMAEVLPRVRVEPRNFGTSELRNLFSGVREFGSSGAPIWLEIGFGDGGHLLHQALEHPQVGIIGCEPFINGTVKLLRGVEENGLENVRIFQGDFRELFEPRNSGIPELQIGNSEVQEFGSSIDRVFILFPDPWPKKRQQKRRLVSHESLDILARVMKPGARLRIATDHEGYAKWIVKLLLARRDFRWLAQSKADWQVQPVDHIETKYQLKNLAGSKRAIFFEAVVEKMVD